MPIRIAMFVVPLNSWKSLLLLFASNSKAGKIIRFLVRENFFGFRCRRVAVIPCLRRSRQAYWQTYFWKIYENQCRKTDKTPIARQRSSRYESKSQFVDRNWDFTAKIGVTNTIGSRRKVNRPPPIGRPRNVAANTTLSIGEWRKDLVLDPTTVKTDCSVRFLKQKRIFPVTFVVCGFRGLPSGSFGRTTRRAARPRCTTTIRRRISTTIRRGVARPVNARPPLLVSVRVRQ